MPLEQSASWARRVASHDLDRAIADPAKDNLVAKIVMDSATPDATVEGIKPGLQEALEVEAVAEAAARAPTQVYVESDKGFLHAAPSQTSALGLPFWATACGWKFAASNSQVFQEMPERHGYKSLCAKCFPALRASRKRSLGLDVGGQDEG